MDFRQWVERNEEAQGDIEPHEPAIFTSTQVKRRTMRLEKIMVKINKKKPPKPVETNKTAGSNDTNTTTNATTTTDGTDSVTINAKTEDEFEAEDISVKIEGDATEEQLRTDHIEL